MRGGLATVATAGMVELIVSTAACALIVLSSHRNLGRSSSLSEVTTGGCDTASGTSMEEVLEEDAAINARIPAHEISG